MNNSIKISDSSKISAWIFLFIFTILFMIFAVPMGLANAINTMMNTAYRLLVDTCLYLMAIAVLVGALSSLFAEFGVVDLLNRLLSYFMKPLYGLPGAASLGIITTYFSDNPAILTLAKDTNFRKYFKTYQIPALTNLGTAFGMGLIVSTFVAGLNFGADVKPWLVVLCGNLGAVAGSILGVRLMLKSTIQYYGEDAAPVINSEEKVAEKENISKGISMRVLESIMSGGEKGVELGLGIIPGVVVICTIVMMLTCGTDASGVYTGNAYEGIALIPVISRKLEFILTPLFGFSSPEDISVPITALGSAGAALGMIPKLVQEGTATPGDVAVFTAMCMCWSGYLSTHVSMMDVLGCREFTGKAILYHTISGLFAGVFAHWLYVLLSLIFRVC